MNNSSCTILILLSLVLISCNNVSTITDEQFALNTIIKYKLYINNDIDAKKIMDESKELVVEYENLFSRTIAGSDISKINSNSGDFVSVNQETIDLITEALYWSERSNGALDISVGPLVDLWNIGSGYETVPAAQSIENAISNVNWHNIEIQDNDIYIKEGMIIDLGAVAKGYIADKLVTHLINSNVKHGILNLGGNIITFGSKPDDSPFRIGLQNPFTVRGDSIGVVTITSGSIVSSGTYERYFEENGKRYHHIFDSNIGYPVDNGISMVTIISESSTLADILSTTLFVLGKDEGLNLIEEIEGCEAIFIDSESRLFPSSGFLDYFELTNSDFTIMEDM